MKDSRKNSSTVDQSTRNWQGADINGSSNEETGVEMVFPHPEESCNKSQETEQGLNDELAEEEMDKRYFEKKSSFWRTLAKLTNPFYNKLKGRKCYAKLLMTARSFFVILSLLGAFLQVQWFTGGTCFVYSPLGGFTNFPQDVSSSLYGRNFLRLDTVVCSVNSTINGAFNSSMEDMASFRKCGVAGYDATSFYDDDSYDVVYMNFRKGERKPYDIPESLVANITQAQCLEPSSESNRNVLSLTEEDNCGLTAWVVGQSFFNPATSLFFIIVVCLFAAVLTIDVEREVLGVIGPNMSFKDLNFLRSWREDVTKVPLRVRATRIASSNIWYIPFVTFSRVAKCNNFYRFQTALSITVTIGISIIIILWVWSWVYAARHITRKKCPQFHSRLLRRLHDFKEGRSTLGKWLGGGVGALSVFFSILAVLQFMVYVIGNWRLLTGLISNTAADELGEIPSFDGAANTGKAIFQIGGWCLAIYNLVDIIASAAKGEKRTSA